MKSKIVEGNYRGDLQRLVTPELHIDEYKSKMGNDDDIIVLSFKVLGKDPAQDLVTFFENGYDYILDADVSPGEISPGKFLVFVELPRRRNAVARIYQLVEEALNLTLQEMDEWSVAYGKAEHQGTRKFHETVPFTYEALERMIPNSPRNYREVYNDDDEIANLKTAANLPVNQFAPDDEFTEVLKTQSGQI